MKIREINQRFSVSDQVQLMDLETIAAQGFKGIVNFRPDSESGEAQPTSDALASKAASQGMAYAHIPVQPNQIQPQHLTKLEQFIATNNGPILGFCRTGNRATQAYQQLNIPQETQKPACCSSENQTTDSGNTLLKKLSSFFK